MQTIKLAYHTERTEDKLVLNKFRKQFSNCVHYALNRLQEGMSKKEVYHDIRDNVNNIDLINAKLVEYAIADADAIKSSNEAIKKAALAELKELKKDIEKKKLFNKKKEQLTKKEAKILKRYHSLKHRSYKVLFGGKKNFLDYIKGNISKEEFQNKRLGVFSTQGYTREHGNQYFRLNEDLSSIMFRFGKDIRVNLFFDKVSKNYKKILEKLYLIQVNSESTLAVKFDGSYVYLSFDEKSVYHYTRKNRVKNRVFAIDMNPNYVGWSVVDWTDKTKEYTIVKTGVMSIKAINDKDRLTKVNGGEYRPMTNKRHYEVLNISKNLIKKAIYYHCDIVAFENLELSSEEKGKGRAYNRLVNNMWYRAKFLQNFQKRANIFDFKVVPVKAAYSSKFGNILFRKHQLPDMVNASIEIGRRGFEFNRQHVEKTAEKTEIIHADLNEKQFSDVIPKSLEEFGLTEGCNNLYQLHKAIDKHNDRIKNPNKKANRKSVPDKNAKIILYRVPLDNHAKWFKITSKRSLTTQTLC